MPDPKKLEERVHRRLAEIKTKGLLRRLGPPVGIDLSSNDYLGLANHPALKQAMAASVLQEGCGSTGSRLLRGQREAFSALEARFAQFKRTAASLYFGSGYAANIGALTTFIEKGDVVFSDQLNHASIIDGLRLTGAERVIFPHRDIDSLNRLLNKEPAHRQKFLVTESIFSMDGDKAPLAEYAQLCEATNTALIIDDGHAVGIYGDRGTGLIEELGIEEAVFISTNPAGKALGVAGAFVAGSDWAIDYLVQRARSFIFSTAPPPAIAAALDAALTIIASEPERRERLKRLAQYFHELLKASGLSNSPDYSQIFPIILGDNHRAEMVTQRLQAEGFDIRAIRPPTVPDGTARLRVSLNYNLTEQTLSDFTSRLVAALNKYPVCDMAYS